MLGTVVMYVVLVALALLPSPPGVDSRCERGVVGACLVQGMTPSFCRGIAEQLCLE